MNNVIFCPEHVYFPYCEFCRTYDTSRGDVIHTKENCKCKNAIPSNSQLQQEIYKIRTEAIDRNYEEALKRI